MGQTRTLLPDGNNTSQRPNYIAGVPLIPPGGQTVAEWLNPAAFAVPAGWNLDGAIEKSLPLTERARLSFRGEAFNALNHPQYANPIANISNRAFGRITNAGAARQLQGAVRIDS